MRGTKSFVGKAIKKSPRGTDAGRIDKAQNELRIIGYKALRDETLTNPNFVARCRNPDLIVKLYGEKVPIEIDGQVHGFGDELTESQQTKWRNDDYVRAGFLPVIVNTEWLNVKKIDQQVYLQCVLFQYEQILRSHKRLRNEKN